MSLAQPIVKPIVSGISIGVRGIHRDAHDYFLRLQDVGAYLPKYDNANNYLISELVNLGGAYWDAMETFIPFVGRSFDGLLVPLRDGMTAPTNSGFVTGDYNPATGLNGDGTSFLNTGVNGEDLPQDDISIGAWAYDTPSLSGCLIGHGTNPAGATFLYQSSTATTFQSRCRSAILDGVTVTSGWTGYAGISRDNASDFDLRVEGSTTVKTQASDGRYNQNMMVFARGNPTTPSGFLTTRLSAYHIGPALDLSVMDTVLTNFMALIANS
jgi:hypothetical protein